MTESTLVNRVAKSGLITFDLAKYYPEKEIMDFDLADYLFKGLILREKDFRQSLEELDWSKYKGKILLVYCSADAIIPRWAYMLIAAKAFDYVEELFPGSKNEFLTHHYSQVVRNLNPEDFKDQRIVVKGCGDKEIPESAYLHLCTFLRPLAKSIMYGEPCSTVPVYKRK